MRWFKHYTDNHRGRGIQALMEAMGHKGLAYYILMEMCAEKLGDKHAGPITEDDCEFIFHRRVLKSTLRLNYNKMESILRVCEEYSMLKHEIIGNFIKIKFPILLKLLDSRYKSVKMNTKSFQHKVSLDKDKDKDLDKEIILKKKRQVFDFLVLYEKYPKKMGKAGGLKICRRDIRTEEDYNALSLAIDRYSNHIAGNNTEAKFIKHFSSFMNCWRDWLDPDAGQTKQLSGADLWLASKR